MLYVVSADLGQSRVDVPPPHGLHFSRFHAGLMREIWAKSYSLHIQKLEIVKCLLFLICTL